jgi:hypothetical protein
MSIRGTASYAGMTGLPSLVAKTVAAAPELGFEHCVVCWETGTGTGTGLAWMVSTAPPSTRFLSFEIDADRAVAARSHPLA